MFNHYGRIIWLMVLLSAASASAGYQFLGNVLSFTKTNSEIEIICEQNHRVKISFLDPGLFRVTLLRSDREDDPLTAPLIDMRRSLLTLDINDGDSAIEILSSELFLRINKSPCRLEVFNLEGKPLSQDDAGMGMGWDGNEVRCWKSIADDDKFFGLGSKGGGLDRRGRELELWNTDFPSYDDRTDPLYQSIPFFYKIRDGIASGIYFNNSYHSRFNFGAGNQRYYSFSADGGDLDYFFIYGPTIDQVMRHYAKITGTAPMPPLWSLGYQQCRWSYYPDTEVMRLAETFREKEIPADVIYLDIHYMDDYRVFTWHPQRFPQPAKMLTDLEKNGFKVVTIIDPGVKVDSLYTVAKQGLAGNHFVHYPDQSIYVGEVWPGRSYFPDFSRGATRDWWGGLIGNWLGYGVDGWGQAFPLETVFDDDGRISDHKKMHNLYGLQMAKATYEGALKAQPNRRPFVLTRAGFAGEQRYTSVWTGDNISNEEHLGLGIRMVLGLSMSGIPFCGTDVGGFIGTPSPELFARWIEAGSLNPLFRTHSHYGSPDQEPWSFGEDVEAISREYISLRYKLLPYFYSLFYQTSQSGTPLLRPLFYQDQADPRVFDWNFQHQFFVGEKMMAAPVIRLGQTLQKVYLPEGKWLDWHSEKVYEGPIEVIVDAPLTRLPVFLREGAIIPSREVVQYTSQHPIQRLQIDVFPSKEASEFQFYEDDGESFDYLDGKYSLTSWTAERSENEYRFSQSRRHNGFKISPREIVLVIHGIESAPTQVTLNDSPVGTDSSGNRNSCEYDPQQKLLTVTIPKDTDTFVLSCR
jgi:alpha-glucosidase